MKATKNCDRRQKEKRPPETQHGIDLPQIPGIPIEILPIHVQTLKVCSSCFRMAPTDAKGTEINNGLQKDSGVPKTQSVIDVLFDRLERSSLQVEASSDEGKELRRMQQQQTQAVDSWLQSIHQVIRQSKRSQTTQQNSESSLFSVTFSPQDVLKHLLQVAVENRKVHVKRASTFMMGLLLQKSSDCRRWFFEYARDELISWMDAITSDRASDLETKGRPILQRESFLLLHRLESDFGYLYPSLFVSLQRFQFLCPSACDLATTPDNVYGSRSSSSSELRRLRDLAIRRAEREDRRVRKLIASACACTDFLVPRVTDAGHTIGISNPIQVPVTNEVVAGNDDDEEEVDWEDGWEIEKDTIDNRMSDLSHEIAVHQTIESMKHTGGLQGGELEIDLSNEVSGILHHVQDINKLDDTKLTRQRLQQIVTELEQSHMLRLTCWLNALTQSDCLVEVTSEKQTAANGTTFDRSIDGLVSMSSGQMERRNDTLTLVKKLKQDVASVVSSAKRLGLRCTTKSTAPASEISARRTTIAATQTRKPNLQKNIVQRRSLSKTSSQLLHKRNRIQIKYRKD